MAGMIATSGWVSSAGPSSLRKMLSADWISPSYSISFRLYLEGVGAKLLSSSLPWKALSMLVMFCVDSSWASIEFARVVSRTLRSVYVVINGYLSS